MAEAKLIQWIRDWYSWSEAYIIGVKLAYVEKKNPYSGIKTGMTKARLA